MSNQLTRSSFTPHRRLESITIRLGNGGRKRFLFLEVACFGNINFIETWIFEGAVGVLNIGPLPGKFVVVSTEHKEQKSEITIATSQGISKIGYEELQVIGPDTLPHG